MSGMVIGKSVGEAMEWFEKAVDEYGFRLEDEFMFSVTLDNLQRRYDVELSPAVVLLLAAPLVERIEAREESQVDNEELDLPTHGVVEETLNKIVHGAKQEPTKFDEAVNTELSGTQDEPGRLRTALAIIRQFWKQFCDIPPFCGESKS